MGWTFFYKPKGKKAIDTIREDAMGADWYDQRVVAATATREAVFLVVKTNEPDSKVYVPDADGTVRQLAVIAIKNSPKARDGYNFGYKDMTETMGPYGLEAPMSIIAQASPLQDPIGPQPGFSSLRSATEYRERSRAKAEADAFKRGLKPGTIVKLPKPLSFGGQMQQTFTVDRKRVLGRKGISTVFYAENGMPCQLAARHLVGATIVARAP
jgi:hypothetical protein